MRHMSSNMWHHTLLLVHFQLHVSLIFPMCSGSIVVCFSYASLNNKPTIICSVWYISSIVTRLWDYIQI